MLQSLTCLQPLDLGSLNVDEDIELTLAEVAALTVSSHLTYLGLGELLTSGDYRHMLPAGRALPNLRTLTATMQLLSSHDFVHALASSCPALEDNDLSGGKQLVSIIDPLVWHTMRSSPSLST